MKHFAGLDVSLENTSVCVLDADGQIVSEISVVSHADDIFGNYIRQCHFPVEKSLENSYIRVPKGEMEWPMQHQEGATAKASAWSSSCGCSRTTARPASGSNRRSGRRVRTAPRCGSFDVQCGIKHRTMTHRCPGLRGPAPVQPQDRQHYGRLQAGLSGLGHRHLSGHDESSRASAA